MLGSVPAVERDLSWKLKTLGGIKRLTRLAVRRAASLGKA